MFFSLTDQVLDDLNRRVDNLSPWVCPDVKAKLRAAVADTVKKRGPVHQDTQCQITECVRPADADRIAQQFDSRSRRRSPPTRWEWIAETSSPATSTATPEDMSEAATMGAT
jgi:hypothetical protein